MSRGTFFAEGFCLRQVEHVSANNNNLNAKKHMSFHRRRNSVFQI